MALAERRMAAEFGDDLVDHHTYVLAADGDLMEGISQEAIALAGHLKLNKLIVLFDDNGISIDGAISLSDSIDQVARFEAAGWAASASTATTRSDRGRDRTRAEIRQADADRLQDHHRLRRADQGRHRKGARLAARRRRNRRRAQGPRLGSRRRSKCPQDILDAWRAAGSRGAKAHARLGEDASRPRTQARAPSSSAASTASCRPRRSTDAVAKHEGSRSPRSRRIATRKASEMALEVSSAAVPEMIGGSADLTGSNNTSVKGMVAISADNYGGRYIHYGIREHGMAAAMNGMALHGGLIPYAGTFLVFSDYLRPAIRLAALMGKRVIHVMTHDSIGLGEDGPTHQPVEHLAALRAIPNLKSSGPATRWRRWNAGSSRWKRKDRPTCWR